MSQCLFAPVPHRATSAVVPLRQPIVHDLCVITSGLREVQCRGEHFSVSVQERMTSEHLVVCIHGLGCSKESFSGLFSVPVLERFSICAIDLPGHGESVSPADFTYGMEEHADVVSQVIAQLEPSRVSIVAHSMGGAVGVIVATSGIDVERFVSIEGNLVAEDCSFASRRMADQTFEEFSERGFEEFLRTLDSSGHRDRQVWSSWLRRANPKAVHGSARSLVQWSESGWLLDAFNNLDEKTYIHGDEDRKDFLLPRLRGVRVTSISKAGHFCMIDNPEEFHVAVAEGLK